MFTAYKKKTEQMTENLIMLQKRCSVLENSLSTKIKRFVTVACGGNALTEQLDFLECKILRPCIDCVNL